MSASLPSGIRVSALLRRINDAGGQAVLRARGHAQAGGILVIDDTGPARVLERGIGPNGATALIESAAAGTDIEAYWRRRRERDPDLWVVELNVPAAERFAAETLL